MLRRFFLFLTLICVPMLAGCTYLTLDKARDFPNMVLEQKIREHRRAVNLDQASERQKDNLDIMMTVFRERHPQSTPELEALITPEPEWTRPQSNAGETALKVGIAVLAGVALAAAAKNGSTPTLKGYQGCCSYHGGIRTPRTCNRFTGTIMCNDGRPSPTCACD